MNRLEASSECVGKTGPQFLIVSNWHHPSDISSEHDKSMFHRSARAQSNPMFP